MNKDLKKIADHLIDALENRPEDFEYESMWLTDTAYTEPAAYYWPGWDLLIRWVIGNHMEVSTPEGLLNLGRIQGYRAYRAFAKWKSGYHGRAQSKKIKSALLRIKTFEKEQPEKAKTEK